jgi:hypothetical protein
MHNCNIFVILFLDKENLFHQANENGPDLAKFACGMIITNSI